MLQPRGQPSLALEALAQDSAVRRVATQLLDCDVTAEPPVAGAKDLAHATARVRQRGPIGVRILVDRGQAPRVGCDRHRRAGERGELSARLAARDMARCGAGDNLLDVRVIHRSSYSINTSARPIRQAEILVSRARAAGRAGLKPTPSPRSSPVLQRTDILQV